MSKKISFCSLCTIRHALKDFDYCWWCYQSVRKRAPDPKDPSVSTNKSSEEAVKSP